MARAPPISPSASTAFTKQPGSSLVIPSEAPGPSASAKKLVHQVPVAGLDVDKPVSHPFCHHGRFQVAFHQLFQLLVGPDHSIVVRIDIELLIQQRMMVGNPWCQRSIMGTRETS